MGAAMAAMIARGGVVVAGAIVMLLVDAVRQVRIAGQGRFRQIHAPGLVAKQEEEHEKL